LVPVGHLPGRSVPVATSGPNFTIKYDPVFDQFAKSGIIDCSPIYELSDCERVRPLKKDLDASILKCDVPCICPSRGDIFFDHAMKLSWQYLYDDLTVHLTPDLCKTAEFNFSASAGFPYTKLGYRSKGAAFESPVFKDLMSRFDYVPLDTVNSKDEFLSIDDLQRHKLRTTFGAPLDKVAKQKFFFDAQNSNIIQSSSRKWIQYGMTKQFGGFHKTVSQLEAFTHVFQSDASGWDRVAPLEPVYELRLKGLNVPYFLQPLLLDTVFHTIFPTILLPDGSVWIRVTGNDSGGNNTASDNSILHLIIVMHIFTIAYYRKYNELPDLEYILSNALVYIYSDDKLGGANLEAFGLDTISFPEIEREVYALYGMVIKPSSILLTENQKHLDPRHEFLGSFCHFDLETQRYIPYPRIGKICSSITRVGMNKDLSSIEFFMKVLQLSLLAYKDETVFRILVHYVHFLVERSGNDAEFLSVLEENAMTQFNPIEALKFHLGWESQVSAAVKGGQSRVPVFNFFLTDICPPPGGPSL
jgi:hypothetical protein